jgi:predicted TIM-barrel fold metal-dependent hydrolase
MSVPPHPLATASAPATLPPFPEMARPSWTVPAGATCTHAHVIGDGIRHRFVATRSFTSPEATEAQYLAMLDGLGLERGVLVQVSMHGTDNALMTEVLKRHPGRLRGIGVCAADVPDRELQALHDAGVRGLRINLVLGGGVGFDAVDRLAERLRPIGWHLQFLIGPDSLVEYAPRIARLPLPVSIDHIAMVHHRGGIDSPAFKALLGLVKAGNTYVKLSGAYRASDDLDGYGDTLAMPQALIAAAPERMLWGTDWPHVHLYDRMIRTGPTLELLGRWAPDEAVRARILVDNPARLYDF